MIKEVDTFDDLSDSKIREMKTLEPWIVLHMNTTRVASISIMLQTNFYPLTESGGFHNSVIKHSHDTSLSRGTRKIRHTQIFTR